MRTAQEIVNEKGGEITSVSPDTTLCDAIKIMVDMRIGSILVKENDKIVGKWTEGDLLEHILEPDFDIMKVKIGDVMTKDFPTAPHTATVYSLMDKFLGGRTRHLMIKRGDKFIGILSIGDAIRACLSEKEHELEELTSRASWEYYEDWRKKKIK